MATRTLTTGTRDAAASSRKIALIFLELDFPSGFVRVTNASFAVTWNGNTWGGLANLGKITEIREVLGMEATGYQFTLSGVDGTKIATALNEQFQGRAARMWLGFVGASGIIADPVQIMKGRMDTMPIVVGKECAVSVNVENRLAAWSRAKIRRFSDGDQQAEFPGDLGLQYISEMASGKEQRWGSV